MVHPHLSKSRFRQFLVFLSLVISGSISTQAQMSLSLGLGTCIESVRFGGLTGMLSVQQARSERFVLWADVLYTHYQAEYVQPPGGYRREGLSTGAGPLHLTVGIGWKL